MAEQKPLRIGTTVPIQQFEATDTLPVANIPKQMSITADGSGLMLDGDSATPGNTKLYGTNGSGVKGWYAQPSGGGGGSSDALGTGFISGGGSGSIPAPTSAAVDDGGGLTGAISVFGEQTPISVLNLFGLKATDGTTTGSFGFTNDGGLGFSVEITDGTDIARQNYSPSGFAQDVNGTNAIVIEQGLRLYSGADAAFYYGMDNAAYVMANDRRIPDVGTVNLLKQTPVSYDNASAPNNCIFYSTTDGKLSYKDPGGTVNNLY